MAFRFDADTKWLSATTNLPSSTNYTLCGWAQTNGTSVIDGMIATHWDYNVPYYNQIAATADGLSLYFVTSNGGGTNHGTLGTPGQNAWFFWALTCGGTGSTDSKAYYALPTDTAFSVISAPGTTYTPTHVEFGNDTNYNEWCNSTHGPIYMYDGVLTEAELFQQRSRYLPVRPDILNRWVDGLSGTATDAIKDRSGLGRDLTQNGTVSMVAGPPLSWGGPVLTVVSKPAGTTYANTVTETGSASDTTVGFIGVPVTETVTATDTVAPASGSIFNITVTETGTAGFTTTGGSIYAASTSDSVTANFTTAIAASTWAHTVTETGSASMTPTTVLGTGIRRGQSTGLQLFGQSGSPILGAGPSTFSFGTAPSPGSAILVPINIWEGSSGSGVVTVGAITDSSGNTYTRVAQVTDATNRTSVELWAAFNIQVLSGTFTLSFTYSGYNGSGGHHASVSAEEFFGLKDTNQPDITGTYNAQNTVATITGSGPDTADYELLVSVFQPYSLNSGTGTFTTTPTGYTNLWTNLNSDNFNATGSADYRITNAIETPTAAYAFSLDDGLADQGLVASFKWVGAISTRTTEAATATDFVTGDNRGQLTATIGNLTSSGAGGVLVTGSSTSTLGNLTSSSAATNLVTGTTSATMGNITIYDEAYDPNTISRGRSTGKNNFANAGSSSNFSFPAGLAPTAGSGVIVTLEGWTKSPSTTTFSISSMSDNQGNVYTKIASVYDATQRTGSEIWAAYSVVSSGTFTISINYTDTAANNNVTVQADEFRNLRASGQPDQTGTNNGAGPSTATTGSTTSAVELVVSVASAYPARDGATATITYPSGYRNLWGETADNNATGAADYQVVTSTGTQSATYNFSTNTGNIGVAVATLFSSLAISGVVTSTISNITSSATASNIVTGTSSNSVGSIAGSSTATDLVSGTLSSTLSNLTGASAGTNLTHGAGVSGFGVISLASTTNELINAAFAQTVAAITVSSTATDLTHATLSSSVGVITGSSSGTVSENGSLAVSMNPLVSSSAGTVSNAATVAITVANLTSSSTAGIAAVATASNSVGSITFSGTSQAIAGGTLAAALGTITISADGTSIFHATGVSGFDDLTSVSDATVLVTGNEASTLSNLTAAGSATLSISGSSDVTLGNLTLATAGTESITAVGSVTLGNVTASGTGTVSVSSTLSSSIGIITPSITVGNVSNAVISTTMSNLSSVGSGVVLVSDLLNQTIANLTGSSSGGVLVSATESGAVGSIAIVSSAGVLVTGTSSSAIGVLSIASSGTEAITATGAPFIGAITASGTGTVSVTGSESNSVGNIGLLSSGFIGIVSVGQSNYTIPPITVNGVATNPIVGSGLTTVPAVTSSSGGTVTNQMTLATTVGNIGLVDTGAVSDIGVATGSVGSITAVLAGQALNPAVLSQSIGTITGNSAGIAAETVVVDLNTGAISSSGAGVVSVSVVDLVPIPNFTIVCTVYNPLVSSNTDVQIGAIVPAVAGTVSQNAGVEQSIGLIAIAATTRPIALGTLNATIDTLSVESSSIQIIQGTLDKSIGLIGLGARQLLTYEGRFEFPVGSGFYVDNPPGLGYTSNVTRVVVTPAGAFTINVDHYIYLKNGELKLIDDLVAGDVIKTFLTSATMNFTGSEIAGTTVEVVPEYARVLYLEVLSVSDRGSFDMMTTIVPSTGAAPNSDAVCSCALLANPDAGSCGQQIFVTVS